MLKGYQQTELKNANLPVSVLQPFVLKGFNELQIFVRYWLSVGAQPSEPVQRLLFRTGLLPPPPMLAMGRKGGPRDTRPIDPMTGRYLTQDKPANADQPKDSEGEGDEDGATAS